MIDEPTQKNYKKRLISHGGKKLESNVTSRNFQKTTIKNPKYFIK